MVGDIDGLTNEENMKNTIIAYEGKQIRVLIADDIQMNRQVLKQVLMMLGFEIEEACNGEETLLKVSEFKPHVLLLDLIMPNINGFDVIRSLREESFSEPVIIVVSANVSSITRIQCLRYGCNDFISKPVNLDDLLHKIQVHTGIKWIYKDNNIG